MSGLGEGVMGNREIPRIEIPSPRGARAGARSEEEGRSRGKHGFPRATEPQAKEEAA
jgi:hypothetical protein